MRIKNKKTGEIKEVSIKELNQYGLGGSVYVKNKLTKLPVFMEEGGEVVNPNNPVQLKNVDIVYKRPVTESTFDPYQQNAPIIDRGNFSNIEYTKSDQISKQRQNATNKRIAQEQLQQELSARKAKEKGTAFTLPTGATKKYKDMNLKERSYVDAQVLKNKGRWNENQVEQPFLNTFNPITMLYDMGAGLGEAPLMSDVTNSYMPYVTGVGVPLTAGALAGISANTTGQFVNELINPLAGIKNPFKNKNFKSEINWGNWNKEIPENLPLMQEYNAIEQTTKANGTWMKNSDGSKFKGTPEQFVQQNSENFKKAFGKDFNTAYRGQRIPTDIMNSDAYPSGITFLGDKDQAMTYGETWKKSHSGKIYQPDMDNLDEYAYGKKPALYELIYPNSNNKKIITHSNVRDWRELTDDEVASQMDEYLLELRGKSKKGEQFITTDDVANFVDKNNLDHAYLPKIRDYGRKPDRRFFNLFPGKSVGNTVIVNSKPGNYLKSRWYNNGMFDMTNPNIYKAIIPAAIGVGALNQKQEGGAIITNRGQWDYPGQTTIIPSNKITMQGVPYPVLGVDNLGNKMLMQPEMDYTFPGQYVTEYPMMQKGGLVKYQTGRLVKFNPYENVNRVSSSDGTRVFRLNPEQVENAKKAAAIRNEKIVKEYLQNQRSFIGPDNRTKAERDRSIAARKAYDKLVEKQKVMSQQPIYQFLQNTTPGGYNPNAAYNPVIGNTAEALGYTAAGALGSSVARPAFNFMGEAMNAPIQGIPGLTGSNIVNAGFATHGLKSIMDGSVAKPWREARKTGNPWDYANAVNENLMTALELSPLVGPGYRGALEAGQLSKKGLRKGVDLIHPVGRTLKQIEKEGLANGLSLQEIKKLQLDKVGITSLQREGYFPGVSEIVTEYITPYSYENAKKRILDIPRRIIKGEKNSKKLSDLDVNFIFDYEKKGLVSKPRYDAFRLYAGLPQKNNTFRIAETVPINHPSYSAKQLNNLEKFSLNEDKKLLRSLPNEMDNAHLFYGEQEDLIKAVPSLKKELERIKDIKNKGIDYAGDFNDTGIMGGYNRRYFDNKMEYNDIWDLDLNGLKVEKYFGKPFLSHGQLNYSFEPAEKEINRLIRDGEYYSKNIIKPKPRPKYLDDIDNYTNNFFKQLNQKQFNQKDLIIKNKKQNGGLIKYQTGRLVKFNPYQKTTPIIDRGNFAQHYTKPIVQNVWINPKTGLPMTKDEAEMSKAQQIAQNQNPGSIRKTVPVSAGRRALDIVSNPMTAAQQAIAKQPITGRGPRNILDNAVDLVNPIIYAKAIKNTTSNVVHPIETLKKLGNAGLGTLQYITEGSTNIPVGEGYGVLFDGLMTAGALKSAKPFLKTPLSKTGEYLTTQTPLKNTWKLNPISNKKIPLNKLYHKSNNPNLTLDDIDLFRIGKSQLKKRHLSIETLERPAGFYTSDEVFYPFMGGRSKYSFDFPANSKIKDLAIEGRITDRISQKELKKLADEGYDIIKGKNMIGQIEYIPLNKSKIQNWKFEGTAGQLSTIPGAADNSVFDHLKPFAEKRFQIIKPHWLKGYPQIKVPKQSIDPKLGKVLNKQGFINPVEIVDRVVPRINPFSFITGGPDVMSFSPLNFIPGYGKKLSGTKNQAFRKFGNSIQDVAQRQALSPAGGSKFKMGKNQILKEGNWAALENPWEKYSGVFEATFDKTVPNNNLSFLQGSSRSGVLIRDAKGNFLPEIPLTEPGMQLNRRLPFSTRYVPINKQKLIDGEFQLATQLPHLQSLTEKYGILVAGAGGLGYFVNGKKGAKENIKTLNKYTIDPIIKLYQKADKELNKGPKIYYKNGGQLKK